VPSILEARKVFWSVVGPGGRGGGPIPFMVAAAGGEGAEAGWPFVVGTSGMGTSAVSWDAGGGGTSRPLTIAWFISSPSPPRTISSSSPKREPKLRVLSAGEPGASSSPLVSTAAGAIPFVVVVVEATPLVRSPAPNVERDPAETPFMRGSGRISSQIVLAVCERKSKEEI